jgi:hypothetical protein
LTLDKLHWRAPLADEVAAAVHAQETLCRIVLFGLRVLIGAAPSGSRRSLALTSRARICDIKLSWSLPASAVLASRPAPGPGSAWWLRLAPPAGPCGRHISWGARNQPRSGFAFARHGPFRWRAFLPPAPARLRCSRPPWRSSLWRSPPSQPTLLPPQLAVALLADPVRRF